MPQCLPCGKLRNTPCRPAACRAFHDTLEDRITKQRIIQAQHQLAALKDQP